MKKLLISFMFAWGFSAQAQSVTGLWKVFNSTTLEPVLAIELYEANNLLYGRVLDIIDTNQIDINCSQCEGEYRGKPVKDMIIINGLYKDGHHWKGGKIIDVGNGLDYIVSLRISDENTVRVHGYDTQKQQDGSFFTFGKTAFWNRIQKDE